MISPLPLSSSLSFFPHCICLSILLSLPCSFFLLFSSLYSSLLFINLLLVSLYSYLHAKQIIHRDLKSNSIHSSSSLIHTLANTLNMCVGGQSIRNIMMSSCIQWEGIFCNFYGATIYSLIQQRVTLLSEQHTLHYIHQQLLSVYMYDGYQTCSRL